MAEDLVQAPLTLIAIHGGSHGAWCWDRLRASLAVEGLELVTFDLPGSGDDVTPMAEVTWESCVDRAVAALDDAPGPVLLIGHSLAGPLISQAAERRPEKVRALLYLAALSPLDGEAVAEAPRLPDRFALTGTESTVQRALRVSSDGDAYELDLAVAIDVFYSDCPADVAAGAASRLRPQAIAPLTGVLRLTPERWGKIPKTYVVCLGDRALPPLTQRGLAERMPATRVMERPWGHSAFLSNPQALADLVKEIADDCRVQPVSARWSWVDDRHSADS